MRKRTKARVLALQILYQIDITGEKDTHCLENFWLDMEDPLEEGVKEFTAELVKGVSEHLGEIDNKISHYATNWQIERMAVVDRNVMRLSCYELLYRQDIPAKVSINEAVELAKKYSCLEASKFVNGILDKIKSEKDK